MLCIKEVGFSSIFILVFTEKNLTKGIMIWCYQSILLCRVYCISLFFHDLVLPSHLLPVLCIRHTGPSTPHSGKICKAFLSMPAIRQSGKSSLLPRLARHALLWSGQRGEDQGAPWANRMGLALCTDWPEELMGQLGIQGAPRKRLQAPPSQH